MAFIQRNLFGGAITAQTPSNLLDAAFHFDSLAHDNSAVSAVVDAVNIIPNDRGDDTPSAILLSGTQQVPKFNHTEPDAVHILLALYRVTSKAIDLVVSFNIPTKTGNLDEVSKEYEEAVRKHFDKFVRSLKIVDYGLFA
ncbi:hypothetical protein C0992_010698 [Termitomyces sp. T32_za158]|nr:hypothetical protein C0992_010698 [Termitomyces sp. T32_za158]